MKLFTVTPLCCITPFIFTTEPVELVKFAIKLLVEVPYGRVILILLSEAPQGLLSTEI